MGDQDNGFPGPQAEQELPELGRLLAGTVPVPEERVQRGQVLDRTEVEDSSRVAAAAPLAGDDPVDGRAGGADRSPDLSRLFPAPRVEIRTCPSPSSLQPAALTTPPCWTEEPAMAEAPRILLEHHLKKLKLPTVLREYQKLARQCATEGQDYVQFLARMVEMETIDRERRLVERRIRQARFPVVKQLESFDFKAIPSLNKMLVLDLARGDYIERRENAILLGPSGVGKTHIALALGPGRLPEGPLRALHHRLPDGP